MEAYRLAGVTCTLSRSDGAKDPLEER
jgi:hypothetical protein